MIQKRHCSMLSRLFKTTGQEMCFWTLLICKDKDNILAKYSLKSSAEPLAVSEYELAKLYPVDFKSSLPTIEEIESELGEIK